MKKIKMIIVFLLLISNLLKAETLEMNLVTFATLTSEANNINILIDEELRKENFVFIVNDNEPYLLSAFRKAVTLRGLELVFTEEFYYVRNKEAYLEEPKYRAIKLNFVKFEDIVNFLNVYEDKIKYEFIKTSKTLLLKSKENEFKSIYQMIKSIDILPTQLKLKITILDTNIDKLIENGADYTNLNFTNNSNFFFNLVSYPFTVKNELSSDDSKGFYTFLKFLNENSISELKSSPVLSLSDEQQSILDVSDNVPTLTGSVTVDDNDTKTTQAYEYKDVGTRIVVTPHIYKNEDNEINVYLDLELNVSNVVSNSNNLLTTSKKYIKQSFHLPLNRLFVLTGINKKEFTEYEQKVPLLHNIPWIGNLFKFNSQDENNSNLTIVFEVINENDFSTDNFNILIPNK
ncbi:type II secretion system protein GspD [Arcobacter aquimarinus]|uniref:type II secretion system protein GspD n=1 Tax=Arcobacter aquimarinus TaxID=1315211 RepID=UPI003BB03053